MGSMFHKGRRIFTTPHLGPFKSINISCFAVEHHSFDSSFS